MDNYKFRVLFFFFFLDAARQVHIVYTVILTPWRRPVKAQTGQIASLERGRTYKFQSLAEDLLINGSLILRVWALVGLTSSSE